MFIRQSCFGQIMCDALWKYRIRLVVKYHKLVPIFLKSTKTVYKDYVNLFVSYFSTSIIGFDLLILVLESNYVCKFINMKFSNNSRYQFPPPVRSLTVSTD